MGRNRLTLEDARKRREIRLERMRRAWLGETAVSSHAEATLLAQDALVAAISIFQHLQRQQRIDPVYVRGQLSKIHYSWQALAKWSKWLAEGEGVNAATV